MTIVALHQHGTCVALYMTMAQHNNLGLPTIVLTTFMLGAAGCGGGARTTDKTTFNISGTVSGDVASGITVSLTDTTMATTSTLTDASGHFSFDGLANGRYTITSSLTGYTFSPDVLCVAVNGNDVLDQNFSATATAASTAPPATVGATYYGVSGTVSGAAGAVSGMELDMVSSSYTAYLNSYPDSAGNYHFAPGDYGPSWLGLPNGSSITITPSHAGYTFIPPSITSAVNGSNVTNLNFVAFANTPANATSYSISGMVSGAVTSGVTVSLTGASKTSTSTGTNGYYSFAGLANGSYTITPSCAGYNFDPASITVTVNGGNVINYFTSIKGPTSGSAPTSFDLSGTVFNGPSSGVVVEATDLSSGLSFVVWTDGAGNYDFAWSNIPAGSNMLAGPFILVPSFPGYTFSPSRLTVTVNGSGKIPYLYFAAPSPVHVVAPPPSGE